jgi:glutamate N-acetyltransferase/amino-acid N-acetyltransferase
VEAVARTVANSPLVKTALHGADPNWGRLIQATGAALAGRNWFPKPLVLDLSIEGTRVCSASTPVDYDQEALALALQGREIEYEVTLPGDGTEVEVFFSDLGHEYIRINAEYTT